VEREGAAVTWNGRLFHGRADALSPTVDSQVSDCFTLVILKAVVPGSCASLLINR